MDSAAQTSTAPSDREATRSSAETLMRDRRWDEAAALWERIADRDLGDELKRRLSRNLASLKKHRRPVYDQLVALPSQNKFGIAPSAAGPMTILAEREDGSAICFSQGSDPVGAIRQLMPQIRDRTPSGEVIGLCGIGDGYLFYALSAEKASLLLDMQQPIFLCEPEPQVLLLCLMIHDYTGPAGPIEQERVRWFVGADWQQQLSRAVNADLMLGLPAIMLMQGLDGSRVQAGVQQLIDAVLANDQRDAAEIEAYYAARTDTEIAAPFQESPLAQPRVLLLTTRFSTVLQYSTRDTADAFRALGWEARVIIEPSASHRVYRPALRRIVAEFKPDLFFQIDHLRNEHAGVFPTNLPFACWVQDHLQSLKVPKAAASVGRTDFVLTDAGPIYATTFNYPSRQCVPMAKLTRAQRAPQVDPSEQDADLVFVSNASHVPEQLVAKRVATYDGTAAGRSLLAAVGERIIACYRDGGSIGTFEELCAVLRATAQQQDISIPAGEAHALADWLFHPLNDALYRQQAMGWAAAAADGLGLTLSLYGNGWEQNPTFARYARGPIAYGAALDDLTRRSRINLQVVPYLCLHQRLLDGLVAGGFYLIRSHTTDTACRTLLDFLQAHDLLDAESFRDADARIDPSHRETLHRLTLGCRPAIATSPSDDPVATILDWWQAGYLVAGEGVLPKFESTSFSDAASFRAAVERFIGDRAARDEVAAVQRQSVLDRLTYEAGLGRALTKMRELLSESQGFDLQIEMMEAVAA